jgi:hypothetical protein
MHDDRSEGEVHTLRKRAGSGDDAIATLTEVRLDRRFDCVRELTMMYRDTTSKERSDVVVITKPLDRNVHRARLWRCEVRRYRLASQFN